MATCICRERGDFMATCMLKCYSLSQVTWVQDLTVDTLEDIDTEKTVHIPKLLHCS